jgi:hypothetical protein
MLNLVSVIKGRTHTAASENRALRRIFRPQRDEIIGCWRKLHFEELHNLYSSPTERKVKEDKTGRACSTHR